jgi:alpha-glucosidase
MKNWWKGSVIYQIYPRSFLDTTGNGIGDIKGIIKNLDYISNLGVDAIWLSPVFTSPMNDMGYDVSHYTDIDPLFGSLEDFDEMVKKSHELNLKVVIDQVLSHSSDQLPFFKESRTSKDSEKSDWYVWADSKEDGSPPNNWLSVFGGPAWEWEPLRGQYYLHNFLPSQPDFNFHNVKVQSWLLERSRFWLERGIDGFRLDTVNYYFHDKKLRSNPPSPINYKNPPTNPRDLQDQRHAINQTENLKFLEKYRSLLDEFQETTSVGEVGDNHRALEIMNDYTNGNKRLHMAYSFDLLGSRFTASHIKNTVEGFFRKSDESWPCWSFSNHDVTRHVSRWNSSASDNESFAKLTGAILMSLKGSVSLYQGEELGQTETELGFNELTDPPGIRFWPANKGRDGCRTPMTWNSTLKNAGFSESKPWLPVKERQKENSVNLQIKSKNSVLSFYSNFLIFRKLNASLVDGSIDFKFIDEHILFYIRIKNNAPIGCIFNLSKEEVILSYRNISLLKDSPSQKLHTDHDTIKLSGNGFGFFKIKPDFLLQLKN